MVKQSGTENRRQISKQYYIHTSQKSILFCKSTKLYLCGKAAKICIVHSVKLKQFKDKPVAQCLRLLIKSRYQNNKGEYHIEFIHISSASTVGALEKELFWNDLVWKLK